MERCRFYGGGSFALSMGANSGIQIQWREFFLGWEWGESFRYAFPNEIQVRPSFLELDQLILWFYRKSKPF